jgi:hypothetical protein
MRFHGFEYRENPVANSMRSSAQNVSLWNYYGAHAGEVDEFF